MRNLYRSADAHDVPRAADWDVAQPEADLFEFAHRGWAQCRAWQPDGVAGEVATARGRLWRVLRLTETSLDIWDGVEPPSRLREIGPPIAVTTGYGRIGGLGKTTDNEAQSGRLAPALCADQYGIP